MMGIGDFMSKFASGKSNPETTERFVGNAQESVRIAASPSRADQGKTDMSHLTPFVDDELSTRLFAAAAGIVEDRRQFVSALDEYKRYLEDAEMAIEDLKREKKSLQYTVDRKDEEIETIRRQVADKQLKYDQLLEDYKQLRANDAKEYERLQEQLKEVRLNYENLNSDYGRFRSESMREVERLEAEVRGGLVKYHQLLDKFNKVQEENSKLTAHILNFTQQMSNLRGLERPQDAGTDASIPIHPVVNAPADESV